MSVAPMLPPEVTAPTRRPGEAVVIPFPEVRRGPAPPGGPASRLVGRGPRPGPAPRPVAPAQPPGPPPPAGPAGPRVPGTWPVARPRRVVRPARQPRRSGLRLTRRGRLVVAAAALLA